MVNRLPDASEMTEPSFVRSFSLAPVDTSTVSPAYTGSPILSSLRCPSASAAHWWKLRTTTALFRVVPKVGIEENPRKGAATAVITVRLRMRQSRTKRSGKAVVFCAAWQAVLLTRAPQYRSRAQQSWRRENRPADAVGEKIIEPHMELGRHPQPFAGRPCHRNHRLDA